MFPSLSTMDVWKVEAELFSKFWAVEKAEEVVVVDLRLLKENWEEVVIVESRWLEEATSDVPGGDHGLFSKLLLVAATSEVAVVAGEVDDPGELDGPSAVEFVGRFERHSCSRPE